MTSSVERLESLVAYVAKAANLQAKPVRHLAQHKSFIGFEADLLKLPGLYLNELTDGEPTWLRFERLREIPAPKPESELLDLWIDLSASPDILPTLSQTVQRSRLRELMPEALGPALQQEEGDEQENPLVSLNEFTERNQLELLLRSYTEEHWAGWAETELPRRKSMAVYTELFMVSQMLSGNLAEAPMELVWGTGIASWALNDARIKHPLVTQAVELALDEKTMALVIKPKDAVPKFEAQIFDDLSLVGLPQLSGSAAALLDSLDSPNPFENCFEAILRTAAGLLDANGVYLPDESAPADLTVPPATNNLAITDSWVIFSRPRSTDLFVQDLYRLANSIRSGAPLPPAVEAIITEPSDVNEEFPLPAYRGISMRAVDSNASRTAVQELFFPLPYNDEQVQIIQRLESSDGVVVQGPPGTGKTHTIANVICHQLALGRRVLVTSMKEPALAVLRDKLPEEIRPLAISLLVSEAEGMKQFEHAITKIGAEVQRIDRVASKREIENGEMRIDQLHASLVRIDREIARCAEQNMLPFSIDGKSIRPDEAARLVADYLNDIQWFPDEISIEEQHDPRFNSEQIAELRSLRRSLGQRLLYLDQNLPSDRELPAPDRVLQAHQDLVYAAQLEKKVSDGAVPRLAGSSGAVIEQAARAEELLVRLQQLQQRTTSARADWADAVRIWIKDRRELEIHDLFVELGNEIKTSLASRRAFIARPVDAPPGSHRDAELTAAISRLAQGKSAFGLGGMLGKREQKQRLDSIRVTGAPLHSAEEWQHVLRFLEVLQQARPLLHRWNALAMEIGVPDIDPATEQLAQAQAHYESYMSIHESIGVEQELRKLLEAVLPSWTGRDFIACDPQATETALNIIRHHLHHHRLLEARAVSHQIGSITAGHAGAIIEEIAWFLAHRLGNSTAAPEEIQNEWTELLKELQTIHALRNEFATVRALTQLIADSGAPQWAAQLRAEPVTETDSLMPEDWQHFWLIVRLSNHLSAIDPRATLKQLTIQRRQDEIELSRTYRSLIEKRTWLKIAEKATPSIRAALEAYRNAIKKIGKGMGVRSPRFRQDARAASSQANAAVPCWIMSHYRVSESLPPDLGAFDLAIIDEASQSDLTALPAILRAKKVLVVGDDKQVSPEGVGLEETKIKELMVQLLSDQVSLYRPQMAPDRSIYDLFKVVFAKHSVMLREHFRCVAPIIEYSKREFYNHELTPLRLPLISERLDPPLIDVLVTDGFRKDKINPSEIRFIVDEIKRIVRDPAMRERSIGVVSLLAQEQAFEIMTRLSRELGEEVITRHQIACGDARTFQGKERDIMFLSMVVSPGKAHAQAQERTAQRFNVAASRARDRMYLVRSVELTDLSPSDRLRIALIRHFQAPFAQSPKEVEALRSLCESPFEAEVFDLLSERGYRIQPQVKVGAYRIDLVVEGENDARLAIECDGDRFHGPEHWQQDMRRQRVLERAGWTFWRCFASTFVRQREEVLGDLLATLGSMGITPCSGEKLDQTANTRFIRVDAFGGEPPEEDRVSLDDEFDEANEPTDNGARHPVEELELRVRVGDLVQYVVSNAQETVLTVRLTGKHNDFSHGLLSEATPLAQALLGLAEGESETLSVPGSPTKTVTVTNIMRGH